MTDTLTAPSIERPDDGLAVITLTAPLDADTTAALRGTLTALNAEGRRHVAIDLASVVFAGAAAGIADLAHQVECQRAAGGELYLISAPDGLAESTKARAFRNRAFWERYGGLCLLPKPHPIRYATTERVLSDADMHYGVPIIELGEESEWAFTLGHHEPRRFLAALMAHLRTTCGCDPADAGLDSIDDLAGFGEKARDFSVIYTHADRVTIGKDTTGDESDEAWCVCDEGGGWYAAEAVEDAPHAVATMTYWIGG